MDIRWHKVGLYCPNCNTVPQILSLSASRDGEIMLEMICIACSTELTWKSNTANLISGAAISDYTEAQPVTQAVQGLTDEDAIFLRKFHIDPNAEAA